MEVRHVSAPAWSAFKSWLLKLTGVPVSRLRLLTGGCPADELPALAKELKRVRADFKKRPNEVSAPADEGLRKDYAALGIAWSAWGEVAREVQRDLKRTRYVRWTGADALEFPDGPSAEDLVTVMLFGGVEQVRPHLLRRASLSEGSLEALWCRWLAGEPLEPGRCARSWGRRSDSPSRSTRRASGRCCRCSSSSPTPHAQNGRWRSPRPRCVRPRRSR